MESEDLVCCFHDRICFWWAENHFLTSRSISFASAYSFCSMAVISHWWFPSCHQWSKGCSLTEQGVVSPYQHGVQYRPHGSPFPCRNPKTCFIPSLSKPNAVIYASPPRWLCWWREWRWWQGLFPWPEKSFCSDGMWQEMDEGSLVFCGAKVQKPNACKRSCGSEWVWLREMLNTNDSPINTWDMEIYDIQSGHSEIFSMTWLYFGFSV